MVLADARGGEGRLPDFVVVGAMKAGSTTLYELLSQHPDLFLSTPKEPEFFSQRFEEPGALAWYRGLFAAARPDQRCGECSTGYSRHPTFPDAVERMHGLIPHARLVYLIRHPARRAWSHYRHRMNERAEQGLEILPFEDAAEAMPEILDSSDYAHQIAHLRRYYPEQQLRVLLFEELSASPGEVLSGIHDFLGVAPRPEARMVHANPAGARSGRRRVKAGIDRLKAAPFGRLARRLLPASLRHRVIGQLVHSPLVARVASRGARLAELPSSPEPALWQQLLLRFAEPNRALESALGRSIPTEWAS